MLYLCNHPEWDNELLNRLSNDFITLKKFPLPLLHIFPRTIGFLGYMKDVNKHYIFDFYLKSSTIDFLIFSETDVSKLLNDINKKNIDIYKVFESNQISHITIGPDGQWLNVVEY